jgi:hypothetical protein
MIEALQELKDDIVAGGQATRQHIGTALALIAGADADRDTEIKELLSGTLGAEDIDKVIKDLNSY